MNHSTQCLLILTLLICLGQSCSEKEGGNDKNSYAYTLDGDWPKFPESFALGNPVGLGVDSKDNIIVFHRASRSWQEPMPEDNIAENTILVLDNKTGMILDQWGENLFIMPHGLEVDSQDNIWVTDVGLHQIFKFDTDGNLLMKLGEAKIPGTDQNHFNLPTDIAVSGDGSFYVSDGYGNSRVVKFSRDGVYLHEWGSFGNGHGEFNIPHGIDLDKYGNVYVADRENNRIQKFDSEGNFISLWQNKTTDQLYSVTINHVNDQLYGIDYLTHFFGTVIKGSDIFQFDLDFNLQEQFGRTGNYDGPKSRYHDIAVDNSGNLYVGDIFGNKIQKFKTNKTIKSN